MAMNSVDTSKGRLRGTYIAIMIPIGVAINYIGGLIASSLGLPIYLDSIGTMNMDLQSCLQLLLNRHGF